jgi:hypothetical protein
MIQPIPVGTGQRGYRADRQRTIRLIRCTGALNPRLWICRRSFDTRLAKSLDHLIERNRGSSRPVGITRVNCRLAVEKRLTPIIPWLESLPVKVAANGTDIDRRRCRPSNCRRVRLCHERGGIGIRLEPAAAIVWQYGEQFRAPRRQRRTRSAKPPLLYYDRILLHLTFALNFCT